MGAIVDYFRRKALLKWASPVRTELLPFSSIASVALLMDVEDPSFAEARDSILAWLRSVGIKPDVHYFDFRKLEKNELLTTSIQNTVLKKELNWYGMPNPVRSVDIKADLFICLVDNDLFATRFFSASCRCRFKIGRRSWENSPFDLVVSTGSDATTLQVFNKMKEYMAVISPAADSEKTEDNA